MGLSTGRTRISIEIYFVNLFCFWIFVTIALCDTLTNANVDLSCIEDKSITPIHQDIQFTFLHNQTHDFARYRAQTNITFQIRDNHHSNRTFKFQIHGRCPSWGQIFYNDSYVLTSTSVNNDQKNRLDNVEITCCSIERDTLIVKFILLPDMTINLVNYTLVLPTIEENTESDLVGVTRIPVTSTGALINAAKRHIFNNTGQALIMTNFHDIFVRHSFPLIDSLTALYTMSLTIAINDTNRHQNQNEAYTVLANTPEKNLDSRENSGNKIWTFETSPPMPGSYLAFVIGRFRKNCARTKRGTEINIWSLPSLLNFNHVESTKFALEMTIILMEYYEEEFDFPYPLSKLDIVEAPLDYEAFIVWGLCFVKPGRLHVTRAGGSSSVTNSHTVGGIFGSAPQAIRETIPKKKEITEILAHEIAHQWFGSLVTPRTWSDVFLSESFATFYGVEAVRFAKGVPQWMASEAMITALTHRKISLHTDPTIPISSPVMYKNWSRDVQFSTIVYHKGATLLRMLKWVIGDKTFRDGVQKYLRQFQYANAGAGDFLDIFHQSVQKSKILGWNNQTLDLKEFLKPYIYQPSYPIVNVRVNQSHAYLTQEPFQYQQHQQTGTGNQKPQNSKSYKWYVPITVHLQSKQMKTYWLKPNDTLCLPVSDFGSMVRLFHLYVVRPIYTTTEGRDSEDDEGMEDSEDDFVLD